MVSRPNHTDLAGRYLSGKLYCCFHQLKYSLCEQDHYKSRTGKKSGLFSEALERTTHLSIHTQLNKYLRGSLLHHLFSLASNIYLLGSSSKRFGPQ